ncbi:MAG TPA: hypothetical protein VMV33_17100 [Rhodocyclaceae bacterium]|nr:hypothetical protein [Rhodocyclaceae bacterium]
MSNWYVSSVGYAAVAQWSASAAVVLGQICRQMAAPAIGNERCFVVTTAGTTGAAEPSWSLNKGASTNDNGVVWKECTGEEAYQSPGNWAAPAARIARMTGATGYAVSGDFVFLASNHAETAAATTTIGNAFISQSQGNPVNVVCVDAGGSSHVPPQSADITTGASITTTGNNSIVIDGYGYYFNGVTFNVGSGATGTAYFQRNTINRRYWLRLDNCAINLLSTGSGCQIRFYTTASSNAVELNNTTVGFANTQQSIVCGAGVLTWRDTVSAVGGTAVPVALFLAFAGGTTLLFAEGVDFSGLGSNYIFSNSATQAAIITLQSCKVGAGPYITVPSGADGVNAGSFPLLQMMNCDSGSETVRSLKYAGADNLDTSITVIRTGGASDGTTGYSWIITRSTVNEAWSNFFEAFPIAIWNSTVGSPVALTIFGVWDAAALPNNDQVWMALEYYGSGTGVLTVEESGSKATILASASALSADSSAWDSQVATRQNSTAYALGDVFKTASNPGRIFICTTAGTTAASGPLGYGSAVDGDSISDGTSVFRAGVRFSQTVTVTPQQAGFIRAFVRVSAPGAVVYIDPTVS